MTPFKRLLATVIAVFSLVVSTALPASATPALPSGDQLFGLDYNSGPYDQLYSIDASTASLTNVGTSRAGQVGPLSASYNPADSTAYYLLDASTNNLASMNPSTGTSTVLGTVTVGNQDARAIGFSPSGTGFVIAANGTGGVSAKLYSLNTSTRATTAISSSGTNLNGDVISLFYNPSTAQFEVLTTLGSLYSVSNVGVFTLIASTSTPSWYFVGAQADSNGIIWATDGNTSGTLATLTRSGSTLTPANIAATNIGSTTMYLQAMFLVPAPPAPSAPAQSSTPVATLAQTGMNIGSWAFVSFGLLGVGILIIRSRRTN
ncbi:MAG: hypothetical protein ACEQR4_03590 [Rhodoluna sp.]